MKLIVQLTNEPFVVLSQTPVALSMTFNVQFPLITPVKLFRFPTGTKLPVYGGLAVPIGFAALMVNTVFVMFAPVTELLNPDNPVFRVIVVPPGETSCTVSSLDFG